MPLFILIDTCMAVSQNGSHTVVLANSFMKKLLVVFMVHNTGFG